MRFHHSTRRGRTKFSQGGGAHQRSGAAHSSVSNRWAQLSYCRQSNIHFNRRLPVEVPESARCLGQAADQAASDGPAAGSPGGWRDEQQLAFGSSQPPPPTQQIERHMGELTLVEAGAAARRSPQRAERLADNGGQMGERPAASLSSRRRKMLAKSGESNAGSGKRPAQHQKRTQRQEATKQTSTTAAAAAACSGDLCASAPANKKLDMEGAREKLIAQVEKHPFWSNKAAKRMRLLDLVERRIFIYELVSHCEKRDLEWRYEPHRGGLAVGRRPLSSLGEGVLAPSPPLAPTAPATPSQLVDANNNNSGGAGTVFQYQQGPASGSQPSSPVVPADSKPHASPVPLDKHQFAFEQQEWAGSPSTPPSSLPAGVAGQPQQQQQKQLATVQSNEPIGSGGSEADKLARARRQTIRRSCSSAASASWPAQQASAVAAAAAATASGQPASPLRTAAALSLSWGEPRPLPSAELVWSIEPPAHLRPQPFASYVHTTEMPDSSFVKRCHGCQGRGRLKCTSCHGVGYEVCISCSGRGTMKSLSGPGHSGAGVSGHQAARKTSDSATVGSMWSNAEPTGAESARLGTGRRDEPGGITGASSGAGSALGGAWTTESCHYCHGAGQKRCWICAGRSYNTCTACAGTGQLRCFLNLNITWMNHRDECVLNNADSIIPRDRLKLSSGLLLADEVAFRLAPLATPGARNPSAAGRRSLDGAPPSIVGSGAAPDGTINDQSDRKRGPPLEQLVGPNELSQLQAFSAKLLDKHANTYERSERVLRQRHRVTQIECHLVNWEWKRRRGHFVIYGAERKVYIAKYPFKSICNIT